MTGALKGQQWPKERSWRCRLQKEEAELRWPQGAEVGAMAGVGGTSLVWKGRGGNAEAGCLFSPRATSQALS